MPILLTPQIILICGLLVIIIFVVRQFYLSIGITLLLISASVFGYSFWLGLCGQQVFWIRIASLGVCVSAIYLLVESGRLAH